MNSDSDARKIDPAMALKPVDGDGLKWFLPAEKPLRLSGFYWYDRDRVYRRLPNDESRMPRAAKQPWHAAGAALLSWHTAGGEVRFRTDSSRIVLRVRLKNDYVMDHMPQTGSGGFDVYCSDPSGKLRFVGVTRFELKAVEYTAEPVQNLTREMREVLIHFPLYNGVDSVFIGVDDHARVEPPAPWRDSRPVVAYGTSILHGGCASRPGMSYPAQLSRRFHMPVLNYGFSGSGKGEPEIARMLAEIADPAAYLIDYEANTGTVEHMEKTLPVFLDILRESHPETPIAVISGTMYGRDAVGDQSLDRVGMRARYQAVERAEVERRRAAGDGAIRFVDGSRFFGEDWDECTVDGIHPTDLGFYRMTNALTPILCDMLNLNEMEGTCPK